MQKTVVTKIDDITGEPFDKGETIVFGFEGETYEIDLNSFNAHNFRRSVKKYVENARRVRGVRGRTHAEPKHDRETLDKVRAWARENGHQVADRGRVPVVVFEAYEKAHA